jgi:transposase
LSPRLISEILIAGLPSRGWETTRKVTQYSEAFKSKMVQRMVGPAALSANRLSQEVGIGQPTLSKWLRDARGNIRVVKFDSPPPPPTNPRRPEDWSPEERLEAVLEASRLKDEELGAFLRRKGLHEAILTEWKASALEALGPQKRTSDSRRVRELEKQLRRKDKALAEAAALLVLQKKVRALLGDEDDDTGSRNDE